MSKCTMAPLDQCCLSSLKAFALFFVSQVSVILRKVVLLSEILKCDDQPETIDQCFPLLISARLSVVEYNRSCNISL